MKNTNHFTGKMLVGAIALALMALVGRAGAEQIQQYVTVVKVTGHARYSPDSSMQNWRDLKKGDVLRSGALIQTAEDGQVDVLLGERQASFSASTLSSSSTSMAYNPSASESGPKANVVRIFPSSVLAVDKLTLDKTSQDEVAETQLDLRAGKIMGNVKKLSSASRYEVKIPNGVAGIRGTTYMIGANGTIYVLTGSVVIVTVDSQGHTTTMTVTGGQAYNAFAPGAQPTAIPANILTILQHNYTTLNGNNPTTGTTIQQNGTTVFISPR